MSRSPFASVGKPNRCLSRLALQGMHLYYYSGNRTTAAAKFQERNLRIVVVQHVMAQRVENDLRHVVQVGLAHVGFVAACQPELTGSPLGHRGCAGYPNPYRTVADRLGGCPLLPGGGRFVRPLVLRFSRGGY